MKETYISSYLRFPNFTRNYFSFLVSTKFIVDVRVEGEKIDDRPKSRMSKTSIKFPIAYSENEFVFLQNEFLEKISLCNTHEIASLSENPVFSIGVNLHKTELNVIIIPKFIIFLNKIGAEIDAEVFITDN